MAKKTKKSKKKQMKCDFKSASGCGGGVYCLGMIGALVYYISTSTSFWGGVWGILKSLVWPAFLVYELLKFLGA